MKKIPWRIIFLLVLAVYLVAILMDNSDIQFVCKWLLMPLLLLDVYSRATAPPAFRMILTGALLFSWAGDVFLLFQTGRPMFFMLGLGSFLLAHVCYSLLFHTIRTEAGLKTSPVFVILIALYYASLIFVLSPHLHEMKIPVYVYGIVISFMLMLALHLYFLSDKTTGLLIAGGAVLFVLSDSSLALNLFYQPFTGAGFIIMLTYGLAQYSIVNGLIRYSHSAKKN